MKTRTSGLTIIEILVVVAIIALLVGLLLPAVHTVQKMAKETKQKAQLTTIELGLTAYKNDQGDYPPSDPYSWLDTASGQTTSVENSSGAQKLAEALLGWDLMGFHPDSGYRVDGTNRGTYRDSAGVSHAPGQYFLYDRTSTADMQKRKGRYLDVDTANAFQLGIDLTPGKPYIQPHDGLFDLSPFGQYTDAKDSFVLCDVFARGKEVILPDGNRVRAGQPILYYRANVSAATKAANQIYSFKDNDSLLGIKDTVDRSTRGVPRTGLANWNPLVTNPLVTFPSFIADPRASTPTLTVPRRPDSYILISAGADGFFGTKDDICNFEH